MIEPKTKRCKGINKAHGFNGCGKLTLFRKNGLCPSCLADWVDTTENGKTFLKSIQIKGMKRIEANDKKAKTAEKTAVVKKSKYEADLQTEINKIARLIDHDKGCVSCNHGHDNNWTRQAHGGHRLSVGSNRTLRFNLDNIHKQCVICNKNLGGNPLEYYKGLTARYGNVYAEYVESLPSIYKKLDSTIDDVIDWIKTARFIVREIEKGKDFTRKEVNQMLGIYK